MSGGDLHALMLAKIWGEKHDVSIFIPQLGKTFIINNYNLKYLVGNEKFENENFANNHPIILYTIRSIDALLKYFIYTDNYDIIISSSHYFFDLLPAIIFNRFKKGIVVYNHSNLQDRKKKFHFTKFMDKLSNIIISRYCRLVLAIDNELIDYYRYKININSCKIINGIERNTLIISNEKYFDCCFVGRLVEEKGIWDIVEVAKKSVHDRPLKIAIVGDGPLMQKLSDSIEDNKLQEHIKLFGYLDKEKYLIISSSKLFLFPSYYESWGMVIMESLSLGVPVLCYDLDVYDDIYKHGIVKVDVGDTNALYNKLICIIDDPYYLTNLGSQGKIGIAKFDWTIVADNELKMIVKYLSM